ncbi:DinB family protein [Pseudomonas sp. Fl4BN1]|uniref:DinB family protein n=1 Tax=Pseudomonas sp. Fl4BN1 TaxID=2697651 RepID=UPI00137888A9|nr:DinB family protein [Pseudomonas sp. Fl4BN1]NBF12664.1 damage-inducible protein DinB [Pseudomonas sp. Fl4BN1]
MNRTEHLCLMARYNQWMNAKLYSAALTLPDEQVNLDRRAFFGSILGTLNHLQAGDLIWLKRFAEHPARHPTLLPLDGLARPQDLKSLLFADLRGLWQQRQWLDQIILDWTASLSEADLEHNLHYANMQGTAGVRNIYSLLLHFFNHQTHHRGQASTLLTQAGVDIGDTDLLLLIPSEP